MIFSLKYNILILCCLLSTLFVWGDNIIGEKDSIIKIKNHDFIVRQLQIDSDDFGLEIRMQLFDNKKQVLNQIMRQSLYDCNSISLTLGTYKFSNDSIVLYTYWALSGDAPVSPFGAKKDVYTISEGGNLVKQSSIIYIEMTKQGWANEYYKGVDFLYTPPSNSEERKLLEQYKAQVEKVYEAKFVLNDAEKKKLFDEVYLVLKKQIGEETAGWENSDSSFGYKK